jgi:hypothetical protein
VRRIHTCTKREYDCSCSTNEDAINTCPDKMGMACPIERSTRSWQKLKSKYKIETIVIYKFGRVNTIMMSKPAAKQNVENNKSTILSIIHKQIRNHSYMQNVSIEISLQKSSIFSVVKPCSKNTFEGSPQFPFRNVQQESPLHTSKFISKVKYLQSSRTTNK